MNKRLVFYLVGNILLYIAPLPAVCCLIARFNSPSWSDPRVTAFLYTFISMLVTGGGLAYGFRKSRAPTLKRRDGIGVVSFSWLLVCFFGALPFYFHGATPAEAFFESVSGFTTTGSSIYSEIESLPVSLLIWRSLTQWIGGLGILVFLVALLVALGVHGRSLVGGESSVNMGVASAPKIKDFAGHLLYVYCALTVLCLFSLLFFCQFSDVEITLLEAFHYTLTTVSTGGFAPHNNSAAHFDSPVVECVLIFFMFMSALSFVLLYRVFFKRDLNRKPGCEEALAFFIFVILAIGAVTIDLMLLDHFNFFSALRQASFPVVSMATSTGFGTVDYDEWPLLSKIVIGFVMMIGGCGGSTAGGLKVMRFVLLLRILKSEIEKTFRPKLVTTLRMDGIQVRDASQYSVLLYIVTVGFILIASSGIVSVMEPQVNDFETAVGAVLATFFNMGPGFGGVGPTDNFAGFHSYTLLFLSWLMLLGRLEIFVLLALFSPSLWKV